MIQVAINVFLTEFDKFLTMNQWDFLDIYGILVCVCVSEIGSTTNNWEYVYQPMDVWVHLFSDKSILAKLGGQLSTNTNIPSKVHFDKWMFC